VLTRSWWRSRVFIGLGSRRGGWVSGLAGFLAVVLVASLAPDLVAPRRAQAAPPVAAEAPAKVVCPKDRPEVTAAAVSARLCGGRVEVAGALT
jgi:hypothetical protein